MKQTDDAFLNLKIERRENGVRTFPKLRVVELVALFLDTVKIEKSSDTYHDYRRWLTEFAKRFGSYLARDITRQIALDFRNTIASSTYIAGTTADRQATATEKPKKPKTPRPYKPKTVNHAVIALKRCWNWGIENEYLLPKNPFSKLPLLHDEGRERIITDEEFQALLRNNTDVLFRQFLLMLRFTSARPGEIRKLTWTMVDWQNHRLVISRHKTSRTQKVRRPRIISIPPFIERLLRWLQKRQGGQPYCFLNSNGQPWKKDAVTQRMETLRRRAGIVPDENGENLFSTATGTPTSRQRLRRKEFLGRCCNNSQGILILARPNDTLISPTEKFRRLVSEWPSPCDLADPANDAGSSHR